MKEEHSLAGACQCGQVAFETTGPSIVSAICYCDDCQAAARRIADLPGAPPVMAADGGTSFVLHRKDRMRFLKGGERLSELRLTPKSTSRRMIAGCCNSPIYLEFSGGHWASIYRARLPATAPAPELRTMTRYRPEGVELSGDIPSYSKFSARFMFMLLKAWIAMGFRSPKIEGVPS